MTTSKTYTVCIYGFVQSHGQANVEKGFNINKNSLVENLLQLSLKVLKSVYDALIAKPHNSKITNTLFVKRKQARSQYMAELKKKGRENGKITRIETKTQELNI